MLFHRRMQFSFSSFARGVRSLWQAVLECRVSLTRRETHRTRKSSRRNLFFQHTFGSRLMINWIRCPEDRRIWLHLLPFFESNPLPWKSPFHFSFIFRLKTQPVSWKSWPLSLSGSPWETEVVSTVANWYLSQSTSSKCSSLSLLDSILLFRWEGNSVVSRSSDLEQIFVSFSLLQFSRTAWQSQTPRCTECCWINWFQFRLDSCHFPLCFCWRQLLNRFDLNCWLRRESLEDFCRFFPRGWMIEEGAVVERERGRRRSRWWCSDILVLLISCHSLVLNWAWLVLLFGRILSMLIRRL